MLHWKRQNKALHAKLDGLQKVYDDRFKLQADTQKEQYDCMDAIVARLEVGGYRGRMEQLMADVRQTTLLHRGASI